MNWQDLIEDARIELGLLHQLVDEAADLVTAVTTKRDRPTEHLAAGAVLQSFYNGVEKVLAMVAERVDGGWEHGDNPREALFAAMCRPADGRPAVLGPELAAALKRCMDFREAFRYGQFFHLNWEQTAPLVIDLPRMLGAFETRLDEFLTETSGEPANLTREPTDLPRYWSQPVKVKTVRLEKKPAIMLCIIAVLFGAITTLIMARKRYGPWVPQDVAAKVIAPSVEGQTFLDPEGKTVELAVRDEKKPFLVTVGTIVENSDEQFTGRMDRRGQAPRSQPALSLDFHQGVPVFFQAVTDQGEFQRGYFREGKPMRFDLCRADGALYRSYHLTSAQRTACMIERDTYAPDDDGKGGYEGWYYRFYNGGRLAAELFMSDDGLLLRAAVLGLEADTPVIRTGGPASRPGSTRQ